MRPTTIIRLFALWLSVSSALPYPAWALRDEGVVEKNPAVLVGLEETLEARPGLELQKTVLNQWHREYIGKRVREHLGVGVMGSFGGFDMPIHYGSIVDEHNAVRGNIGLFDVSHMGLVEIKGQGATQFLNRVTTRRAETLRGGACQVCFIFNGEGDLVDETMVFKFAEDHYRLVVNAGHSPAVIKWFEEVKARGEFAGETIAIQDLRAASDPKDSRLILALQGPKTLDVLAGVMNEVDHNAIRDMKPMTHREVTVAGVKVLISKTGWTGEKGFEFMIHPDDVPKFWAALIKLKIPPIGLGARDSLRLEASLRLSGDDFSGKSRITPGEAGYGDLGFIDWNSNFIGKELLHKTEAASNRRVVNLVVTSMEEGKIDLSKAFPSPRFNEETGTGSVVRVKSASGAWEQVGEIRSSGVVSRIWDIGELGSPEKGVRIAAALLDDRAYAKPGQELQIEIKYENGKSKLIYARVLPRGIYWNGWGKEADLTRMRRFLREVADGKVGEGLSKEFGGIAAGLEETVRTLLRDLHQAAPAPAPVDFIVIGGKLAKDPVMRVFAGLEERIFVYDGTDPKEVITRLVAADARSFQALGGLEEDDPLFKLAQYAGIRGTIIQFTTTQAAGMIQYIFKRMGVDQNLLAEKLPSLMAGLEELVKAA